MADHFKKYNLPSHLKETVTFKIEFGNPVALSKLEANRNELTKGVYFLHEGKPGEKLDPYASTVIYIGKAIGETIYSRCRKLRAALYWNLHMRPGKKFKEYRDTYSGSIEKLIGKLWVIPGIMNSNEPYLISCAEEYLLHRYAQRNNGAGPRANTK